MPVTRYPLLNDNRMTFKSPIRPLDSKTITNRVARDDRFERAARTELSTHCKVLDQTKGDVSLRREWLSAVLTMQERYPRSIRQRSFWFEVPVEAFRKGCEDASQCSVFAMQMELRLQGLGR